MSRSLAFVGCNIGADVDRAVSEHDVCWLFEPIPEIAVELLRKYSGKSYRDKSIRVINAACHTEAGTRPFNLYNVNGLSSSLGTITEESVAAYSKFDLSLIDTIEVNCTVLSDYLPLWLDTLIIDAQGADLDILRTVEAWLAGGRIGTIQIECDGDEFRNYDGLGDNSQASLLAYMERFPYSATRVPNKVKHNPDWVFAANE